MKKRTLTTLALATLVALTAKANLSDALEPVLDDWIEPAYPIIAGIIFLIGVLTNLGKFTSSENRDIKGGIINIAVYVIVIVVIPVVYQIIKNTSL